MKLTRNKIRKIHRQKNQSVRKWRKQQHHKRPKRYNTFRRSLSSSSSKSKLRFVDGSSLLLSKPDSSSASASLSSAPSSTKLNHVLNKTLKNYIPLPVLSYLKQKYKEMRRAKRNIKMVGGSKPGENNEMISMVAAASAAAATAAVMAMENNRSKLSSAKSTDTNSADDTRNNMNQMSGRTKGSPKTKGNAKFNLGPTIPNDISIQSKSLTLNSKLTYQFIDFLITNGKPYYIQIKPKIGDETLLNISDTDIFEIRRILYGEFASNDDYEDDSKIPGTKKELYFKPLDDVGIAGGDSISVGSNGNIMIYTGETARVKSESNYGSIELTVKGNNKKVVVTDSKRLYKLSGNEQAPASIKTLDKRQDLGNNLTPKEFRIQIAPVTQIIMKNATLPSKPDDKDDVFADDNTYVFNFSDGCVVTSIQTLRKSLEVARKNLIDEKNEDKKAALDVFKLLFGVLNNPAFVKSDGYEEFKESVYNYSYKIPGMENKYGFVQLKTYFEENGDTLPKELLTLFIKLTSILGHGPGGKNSECQSFGPSGLSTKILTTLKPMADGTVRQTSEIFNDGTIPSIIELLNESMSENHDEGDGDDDEPAPEVAAPAPAPAPAPATTLEPSYPPLGGGTPEAPATSSESSTPPPNGGTP